MATHIMLPLQNNKTWIICSFFRPLLFCVLLLCIIFCSNFIWSKAFVCHKINFCFLANCNIFDISIFRRNNNSIFIKQINWYRNRSKRLISCVFYYSFICFIAIIIIFQFKLNALCNFISLFFKFVIFICNFCPTN